MEEYPKPVSKQITQNIIDQMNKSFFKVDEKGNIGFFSYIKYENNNIPVLIINNYLNNEDIKDINDKNKDIQFTDIIYKNKEYNITLTL